MENRRVVRVAALMVALFCLVALTGIAAATPQGGRRESGERDPGLMRFTNWLSENRPGYGCDEGPARFHNKTVEAAYPGQRFYYVLAYTRGIPPPFRNPTSLVATIDEEGRVTPFSSATSYGRGLIRIASAKDARLAAAAVSILSSCDPGERRWKYTPDLFRVKKKSNGWMATYSYGYSYSSWVRFDRNGRILEFGGSAPPVP